MRQKTGYKKKNWFRDTKLEALGIIYYVTAKVISLSLPSTRDLVTLVTYIMLVRFFKWIYKTRLGHASIRALKDLIDSLPELLIYRDFEPHNLIQWLTKGKFNTNIKCQEKITLKGEKCRRIGCRFDLKRKEGTPKAILERMALRTSLLGRVYISPRQSVIDDGSLGPPGDFIGWSALGITLSVNRSYWEKVVKRYGRTGPLNLVAHIRLWPHLVRVRIEPSESRLDGNDVVLYGKYQRGFGFDPKKIHHDTEWISVPVCELLQREHNPKVKRTYTTIPIID